MVDAEGLPSITETKAQMLALIDEVQVAVSAVVPATRPWRWKDHWGSGTCLGDKPFGDDGVSLNFPNLVSGYSLSEAQWDLVFPRVRDIAVAAGLTEGWSPNDAAGSHDVRFSSPDGRQLIFVARVATLISARISCRHKGTESLWIGDEIPMPPDPQP
ncbi:hypothetical protein H7J07_08920 [Mycobacterium koreense]|uniref:LppA family lipoprotein n=1 Tax=Mycolicibacillus koreensis TaxID=1069220 RepID=UPI00138B5FEA|nr:LppA family lipoprotein [Mycolicibacillus koreensis]MCV7248340.1 hypothetical protein [Mycolicibacillus koreensis]BBY55280.1 hypothetical protein MKOR_25310 [Mycolicibacillus koreensis]